MNENLLTVRELIILIKEGKVVSSLDAEELGDLDINEKFFSRKKNSDSLGKISDIEDGIILIDCDQVVVFDSENKPIASLYLYDSLNPVVFGDIVCLHGRDGVLLFNKITKELKKRI